MVGERKLVSTNRMGSDAVPSVAVADAMGFARGLNPSYVLALNVRFIALSS
jgi:hypothetical protein